MVACLFTCINLRSHDGFGIAITPYIIYLLAFKKSFKFKNYFIIFFSGLNTDFATCMPQIPAIIFASYILNKNNFQKFIRNNFLIIGTFTFFVFLSNINLVYAQITYGNFHRETFIRESYPFFENLLMVVKDTIFFQIIMIGH